MNELKRLEYLRAMGTDTYISVRQLPGAAATRRLAIVRKSPSPAAPEGSVDETGVAAKPSTSPSPAAAIPRVATAAARPVPAEPAAGSAATELPPRFSLAAIAYGGWLWLEELESPPLVAGQLQLLQAMAVALGLGGASGRSGEAAIRPDVTQFDWPIHTNRQLDLGRAAAASSAAGFIRRKLDQRDCQGLVLLGRSCEARVALAELECPRLARTVSTAAMLSDPLLKRQAWRDLQAFFQSA